MLYRALKNQYTSVVFVPRELVVYYALEYAPNGTGRSKFEKIKTIASLRAAALFTRIMASIKNATTTQTYDVTIDDKIENPETIVDETLASIRASGYGTVPLNQVRLSDINDWMAGIGKVVKFTHQQIPTYDVKVSESASSKSTPDDSIDSLLQELGFMALGLTADAVKAGYEAEFAADIITKNALLNKRVRFWQKMIDRTTSKFISILANNDHDLYAIVKETITEHLDEFKTKYNELLSDEKIAGTLSDDELIKKLITDTFDNLKVESPKPNTSESTQLKQTLTTYIDEITLLVDYIFSSKILPPDVTGEFSGSVDIIKEMIIGAAVRKWMDDNNYHPELSQLVLPTENGECPMVSTTNEYVTRVLQMAAGIGKNAANTRKMGDEVAKSYAGNNDMGNSDAGGYNPSEDTGEPPPSDDMPEESGAARPADKKVDMPDEDKKDGEN